MNFDLHEIMYILRLFVAGLCGMIIGLERKNRSKEAGTRTHFIVACASALMMIVSKYGFADQAINEFGIRGADGARIAAQVVSGVGFLGAGMIFVHKNTITGLTTAAGIWATAGVGLAIGAGMYTVGISATFLLLLAQIVLHMDFKWVRAQKNKVLLVENVDEEKYQTFMVNLLQGKGVAVHDVSVEKSEEGKNYTFVIEIPKTLDEEDIISMVPYTCSIYPTDR